MPGPGVHSGTLVNALLHRFGALSGVGGALRPGIVHRLDRYTSGVLLVAKNDAAHRILAAQFSGRRMEKDVPRAGPWHSEGGEREDRAADRARPVAPHSHDGAAGRGRAAWSEYRVLRRFPGFTLLEVRIGTGRTHQIRVHLSSIGHPVAGDTLYGARPKRRSAAGRFFLHAHRIRFHRPADDEPMEIVSPLPADLEAWLNRL